jgi:hypothetical protein
MPGVAVRQVDVAHRHDVPAGERAGEDGSAQGRVEDAGPDEVGAAAEDHAGPAGPVGGEVPLVQFGTHPPLAAGRLPGTVLGHHRSPGLAVRVERVEHHQAGTAPLDGGQDGLLDPGHHLDLEVVGDVDAVVHDGGFLYGGTGTVGRADVGGDPLDSLDRGAGGRAVHQADGVTPAHQLTGERGAGGAGPQDDVRGGRLRGGGGHGIPLSPGRY